MLGLLVTLLNPEGITPHLLYLDAGSATPGLEVVVDEWLPLSLFALPPANLPPSVLSWALVWVLVVLTPWAAIGQLRAWRAGEGADPVLAALALVSLVGLLSAVRLLWLGIFPLLFLGDCARVQGLFAEGRRWGPALCTGFAVALLPGFVAFGDWPMISRGVQPTRYADPYPATKSYAHEVWFLRDAELEGRLFNSYEMGNFLGYWLAPRMRVFVNGSLNFPKEVMAARTQFERRLGATPGESFAESLDRFEIDVFFGTGLPVVSPPNRPSLHTTTHLENTPGWLPIFRTPRSALYLRNNARNRRNLERVVEYYATRGVPFSTDRGLDLERVAREAPVWAIENGVLPTHLSGLEAATRSLDPLRSRVARDRLATLFATLGLYERAIEIERKRLQAQPGSEALVRRLAWSLLHAGRLGEARTLLGGQAAGTDGWTALARSSSSPEALAAQVAVLPLLSAEQARSVLAGFREPAPRSLPR